MSNPIRCTPVRVHALKLFTTVYYSFEITPSVVFHRCLLFSLSFHSNSSPKNANPRRCTPVRVHGFWFSTVYYSYSLLDTTPCFEFTSSTPTLLSVSKCSYAPKELKIAFHYNLYTPISCYHFTSRPPCACPSVSSTTASLFPCPPVIRQSLALHLPQILHLLSIDYLLLLP